MAQYPLVIARSGAIALHRLDSPDRPVGALIVVNCALCLCTRALAIPFQRHAVALLRTSVDMEVVPHLGQLGAAIVSRARTSSSLVVAWAGAPDVRRGSVLCSEGSLNVRYAICGGVGGRNVMRGEPGEAWQPTVV